jgi:hypothetical protein
LGVALLLGVGVATAPADDPVTPPPESKSASLSTTPKIDKGKAPEFAGYVFVTKVTGEVVTSTEQNLKVRIYWQTATVKNPTNNNRNQRPALTGNHGRQHHNPYATRQPQVQIKWEHHDYDIPYLPDSLVRTKHLPPKLGADGKKIAYSDSELDALKVPYSVPGYQASKSDLTAGTVIELSVVRDKSIPASSVTDKDVRVRYAVIIGQDPHPPKDLVASPGKK